ncbi:MAG TPA: hypothetical protein VKU02_30105 [Gemmataceae bacterium]|nr:hypothetical protein [Gemmataceae bacterium]
MSAIPNENSLTGLGNRMIRAWDRFWFTPGDPTILGLIRICCGLVVLYVHLAYSYDLQTFFGKDAWLSLEQINESRKHVPWVGPPTGWEPLSPIPASNPQEQAFIDRWTVHPSQVMAYGQPLWSIYYHVTDPTWMWVVHGTILTIMLLFTIGFCTRVVSVLTWLGLLCYIQRAPTSLFGMDTIMIVVVLYLMIGPSGAALSVDRLLACRRATRYALREHLPPPEFLHPPFSISANVALRLLQIHVCIIYAASGLSKLQGPAWWSGVAVWGTMANYEFSPMPYRIYMEFLRFLSQHRWLWELVMTGGSYFTLVFEIGFAFLVWNRRLCWTMLVAAVLLHTGIAIFMGLVTFSLMMLTLVLAFVPSATVRDVFGRLRGRMAGPQLRLGKA